MLLAGDGVRLKLGDGATLDDGAADWETIFVEATDITGVEGVTLTTGVEVDIMATTVEVDGLKTSPVETGSDNTINAKIAQQTVGAIVILFVSVNLMVRVRIDSG